MNLKTDSRLLINFFDEIEKETTLCLLDIDDFTDFNRLNSFEKGDNILSQLSNKIKQIPTIKNIVRIDSDEFLFSCLGNFEMNKEHLFILMQTIQIELEITASIGVTEYNSFTTSSKYVLNKLKRNMLTSKCFGKNKLNFC